MAANHILTEGSDFIDTESSDRLVTEDSTSDGLPAERIYLFATKRASLFVLLMSFFSVAVKFRGWGNS